MKLQEIYNQPDNGKLQLTPSERAAFKIIEEITDRRGLRHEWYNIDSDIQEEIFQTFVQHIQEEIPTADIEDVERMRWLRKSLNAFFILH